MVAGNQEGHPVVQEKKVEMGIIWWLWKWKEVNGFKKNVRDRIARTW